MPQQTKIFRVFVRADLPIQKIIEPILFRQTLFEYEIPKAKL